MMNRDLLLKIVIELLFDNNNNGQAEYLIKRLESGLQGWKNGHRGLALKNLCERPMFGVGCGSCESCKLACNIFESILSNNDQTSDSNEEPFPMKETEKDSTNFSKIRMIGWRNESPYPVDIRWVIKNDLDGNPVKVAIIRDLSGHAIDGDCIPVSVTLSNDEFLEEQSVIIADTNKVNPSLDSAAVEPVPMTLWCPMCHTRHIDEGEFAKKPHHTHSCQNCGMTWRPAVAMTVGVQFLPGFKNE